MATNFSYLNINDPKKLQLIGQSGAPIANQAPQSSKSLFSSNSASPERNKQLSQIFTNMSTSQSDPISNLFAAINKQDSSDNQKADGSIFSAPSKRKELMKSLVDLDAKDDGTINGSFLNDKAKSAELMENYKKASAQENKDNSEISNKFVDSLLQGDANENQSIDGSFLNSNISKEDKSAIQSNLQNSINKTDLFRMLLQIDLADDGKANGSVFQNEQVQKVMDVVDDGVVNNSSQNFINYITNKAQADQSEGIKYSADSNYYNANDTYNPGNAKNNDLSAAYGLTQFQLDPSMMSQVSQLNQQTNALINSVNATPYQAGQVYGSTEMKTDPNVAVNQPTAQQTQGTASGKEMAKAAEAEATRRGTVGRCYAGVADALQKKGVNLTGASAYMAADQLANNPKFKEVKMSADQLTSLPAGAVVVWGKTDASPHGHISVALGDGREASDHVSKQMTSLRGATNCRVFMPV